MRMTVLANGHDLLRGNKSRRGRRTLARSLPPPTLGERRHRGLARRLTAVRGAPYVAVEQAAIGFWLRRKPLVSFIGEPIASALF
jgi:hypothetical protein